MQPVQMAVKFQKGTLNDCRLWRFSFDNIDYFDHSEAHWETSMRYLVSIFALILCATPLSSYAQDSVTADVRAAVESVMNKNKREKIAVQPNIDLTKEVPILNVSIPIGPRLGLIIGNSNYTGSIGSLPNPINDAQLLARTLEKVGFQVEVIIDADQKSMKRAISRLGGRMQKAGKGATGLFFFAGHGIQSRGTNYLIPLNAPIEREADLELEAVAANTVLRQMEEAGNSTNLIILDACRNMPLARAFRSGARGLARMDAPNGSFIAYSTAPGSVAADGDGANSPFAEALSRQILVPNQPVETTFREVRRDVYRSTEGLQVPWDSSSLIETFHFSKKAD